MQMDLQRYWFGVIMLSSSLSGGVFDGKKVVAARSVLNCFCAVTRRQS
jgi:hypothetical protein